MYLKPRQIILYIFSFALLIIFFAFIYLRFFTIAYKYQYKKSQALFREYPNSTVFIGGESSAEEGLNPLIIHKDAINLAHTFGDPFELFKTIKLFSNQKLSSRNLVILNTSFITYSTISFQRDYFVQNKADSILAMGPVDWYNIWGYHFPSKIALIMQCRLIGCDRYNDDFRYEPIHFFNLIKNRGALISTQVNKENLEINNETLQDIKELSEKSEHLFHFFQEGIKLLAQENITLVIVIFPLTQKYKDAIIQETNSGKSFSDKLIRAECKKFSNCIYLDYFNWDNSLLGKEGEEFYFANYNHLNKNGVDKFSQILRKDLESIPMLKRFFKSDRTNE